MFAKSKRGSGSGCWVLGRVQGGERSIQALVGEVLEGGSAFSLGEEADAHALALHFVAALAGDPGGAVVARDVDPAVVRARPDLVRREGRLGDGEDHIGEKKFEGEIDAPIEAENSTEFVQNMRTSLANLKIQENLVKLVKKPIDSNHNINSLKSQEETASLEGYY